MAFRRLLCLIALAGGLAGLEGRLIFPAFGQYIRLPPPWNFAAVTIALYGCTALAAMHMTGPISALLNQTQHVDRELALKHDILNVSLLVSRIRDKITLVWFHIMPRL